MLDYSIKLPKNRRTASVGFYVIAVNGKAFDISIENRGKTRYNANNQADKEHFMKAFDKLPAPFQTEEVRPYYEALQKKTGARVAKRVFDMIVALIMLVFLILPILVIAVIVKATSPGHVFFRQERVTSYGRHFRIFKFRTMVENAEALGTQVTTDADSRVTPIGRFLPRGAALCRAVQGRILRHAAAACRHHKLGFYHV